MSEIHLQEIRHDSPRTKNAPKKANIPVPFHYLASDDGIDENLLILLHGLGDTHLPFSNLGRQLKLPQTAVLALRAPEQIPFLYENAFQWYTSFDGLGALIERPNPTPALDLLEKVVKHLIDVCGWPSHKIHLFGFAQGGSLAVEFGIEWWKLCRAPQAHTNPSLSATDGILGSIISISGPLLSYPTLSAKSPTPILIVYSLPPSEMALPAGAVANLRKAYTSVAEKTNQEPGMPSSRAGWRPIMEFWSTHLGRRQVDGLYEVMSGTTLVPA